MTKKEICNNNKSIAYYSGINGFEIKHIEYGIDDFLYAVSNCWYDRKNVRYHKLKIHYNQKSEPFVICDGYKIPLCDCISM